MAVMIIYLVWNVNWQQAYILDFGVLKFSPIKTREERTAIDLNQYYRYTQVKSVVGY